jgi:hypothetical protein
MHWQARTPLPSQDVVVDSGRSRDEVEDLAHVTMSIRGLELSELYTSDDGEHWQRVTTIRRRTLASPQQ